MLNDQCISLQLSPVPAPVIPVRMVERALMSVGEVTRAPVQVTSLDPLVMRVCTAWKPCWPYQLRLPLLCDYPGLPPLLQC